MKLKIFFRQIIHQKIAWMLNIICLSIAFAVMFIVLKQVKYDMGFNASYPKAEDIYQLGHYNVATGKYYSTVSVPLLKQIMSLMPEVKSYTALWRSTSEKLSFYCGETEYPEVPFYGVYDGFLDVFRPRILSGDAKEALTNKSGFVIPQSLAKKWFGDEDPVGKTVGFSRKDNQWTIKAVYEDFPENSSVRNAILMKMNEVTDWSDWSYYCIFRLYEGTDKEALQKKIVQALDSLYLTEGGNDRLLSSRYVFQFKPLKEIYFAPYDEGIYNKSGNIALTLCLWGVGILIIVVAYINFINFSTALAPTRIGTLNLCKIAGASTAHLRRNVVGEAVLLSFLAWCIAYFWISAFAETTLAKAFFTASLDPWENIGFFLSLGFTMIVFGGLAGVYPAYYMTSFQPALALKGSFAMGQSGRRLRNGLLIFQFVVTIVLIICSLFVVLQHRFLMEAPWGFQKENIIYTNTTPKITQSPETFRSELMKNPDILDVTSSRYVPGNVPVSWGRTVDTVQLQFYGWPIAPNFISFFGISIYEGDSLREPPAGKDYAVFNRKMVEKYGLQGTIGKEAFGAYRNNVTILGFAENVNFDSFQNEIEPMAFVCGNDMYYYYIFIKIRPERVHETMNYIKECFAKFGKEDCSLVFLDDYLNGLYQQENNLSRLILLLCLITVIIALSGIYGLILFNIRYKVKEVGIRKINGATGRQILWMLNGIFIRLVFLGGIFAVPVALILVKRWLDTYAYRTPMYWWVFVLALLLTLGITLVTVSWQSWKAANANPVDAVKTE